MCDLRSALPRNAAEPALPGRQRGVLRYTDRIGERTLALPLHTQLDESQVQYIIKTLKDTATNVGAGAPIY